MYAGYVNPSFYAIVINAAEVGWTLRPPTLSVEDIEATIQVLSETSSVVNDGFLDYRFAAALHERKHFLDIHFSSVLWRRFLSWYHCATNILAVVNILKGKGTITLPLYDHYGILRGDLPATPEERRIIQRACDPVFIQSVDIENHLEISASLLQYHAFEGWYTSEEHSSSKDYGYRNYVRRHNEPIEAFGGSIDRAFAFHNFCSWFVAVRDDLQLITSRFDEPVSERDVIRRLLREDGFLDRKRREIEQDRAYLRNHAAYTTMTQSEIIVLLHRALEEIVEYRRGLYTDVDEMIELASSIDEHLKWMVREDVNVPLLVDFRSVQPDDAEISENFRPSRWITPRGRYYYLESGAHLHLPLRDDLDTLLMVQHLANYLVNPYFTFEFGSQWTDEGFLGFDVHDERLTGMGTR